MTDIKSQRRFRTSGHGQAAAIDGNAVAQLFRIGVCLGESHGQNLVTSPFIDTLDTSDLFHESGKHGSSFFKSLGWSPEAGCPDWFSDPGVRARIPQDP